MDLGFLAGTYYPAGLAGSGQATYWATMSLQSCLSWMICFDNCDTKAGRHQQDKLAGIRKVGNKWVESVE